MHPKQRGLGDHCVANWRWKAGGGGGEVRGGSWSLELPMLIQELSAVLNLERRLPGAVRVAGSGVAAVPEPSLASDSEFEGAARSVESRGVISRCRILRSWNLRL